MAIRRFARRGDHSRDRACRLAGSAPDAPSATRLVTSGAPVAESLRLELKQDTALLEQIGRLSVEQSRLLQKWRILKPRESPWDRWDSE